LLDEKCIRPGFSRYSAPARQGQRIDQSLFDRAPELLYRRALRRDGARADLLRDQRLFNDVPALGTIGFACVDLLL